MSRDLHVSAPLNTRAVIRRRRKTDKQIIYGTGAWNMGNIKGKPAIKEAFEMGKLV